MLTYYISSLVLIFFSALFSGLTLGLLSLDARSLKRQANLGNNDAAKVYPVRKNGNLLLTSLLLGNVITNSTLSILLGSVVSGTLAVAISTAFIFLFGEIIPQAVISRYGLWFGARTLWLTKIILFIFYPIAAPIAFILNAALGEENEVIYSKHELMHIISEHEDSKLSPIDRDEERILHGALLFSHRTVQEVMTPIDAVEMFEENEKLSADMREKMVELGFSRYPIYRKSREHVVGVLYLREVLTEDEDIEIRKAQDAFETELLTVKPKEKLDLVMTKMLKKKIHLGVVTNNQNSCVGVISLEDIIEEIIQKEIEDEGDAE
ncbi:DUF21 domain-containing protein [candidate division WWE3 bacterium]|uniref:DUF21 domain-containing protein n=1 Tax=candidate division WWE3 bacterium TaxID=2053526 RepID=A0A955LGR4_UNCKA|nr:DUF21 domain-containing protein [candidate division WWE3 bacterium]